MSSCDLNVWAEEDEWCTETDLTAGRAGVLVHTCSGLEGHYGVHVDTSTGRSWSE